jgi:hypothetical protein
MCHRQLYRSFSTDIPPTSVRVLHVLDVANLLTGRVTLKRAELLWNVYAALVPVAEDDLVYVGLSPSDAPVAAFAFPSRVQVRIGARREAGVADDLAGLLDPSWVDNRFGGVVIGSSNGRFAAPLDDLSQHIQRTHVTGHATRSSTMRRATHRTIPLPTSNLEPSLAAA